ncbi:MAG: hypothetical protein HYR56_26855 [Acidobacteria bacterium]|nr:hypothetical protein [Acidobacteriota bacterium]MBI3427866.1 hypothetical protein [Acidobacteriota bacterium]
MAQAATEPLSLLELQERDLASPFSLAIFAIGREADSKGRIFLELLGAGAGITSVNREQLLHAVAVSLHG